MNGRFLSHLIFADDIVIFSHSPKQLQRRIDELVAASSTVGLKVNVKKTKTMTNFPGTASLSISGEPIEEVNEFVYLGQLVSLPRDHYTEIKRRVQASWNAYRKYKHFLTAPAIAMKLKRRLFNMVIVPTMLYGAETWALTKQAETRLATTQRRMERRMIGVRLLDHRSNEWLRGVTKVVDIVKAARRRKWQWARKVATMSGDRWAKRITEWRPPSARGRGRPRRRWRDTICKTAGANWMLMAQDVSSWNNLGEAYLRNDCD